jgi:hypothetical protein
LIGEDLEVILPYLQHDMPSHANLQLVWKVRREREGERRGVGEGEREGGGDGDTPRQKGETKSPSLSSPPRSNPPLPLFLPFFLSASQHAFQFKLKRKHISDLEAKFLGDTTGGGGNGKRDQGQI